MKRGGVVFIFLVVALFIIVSIYAISAAGMGRYTKRYESHTDSIQISDGQNDVANMKLNTPILYKVIRGKDRLIAEFTIENFGYSADDILGGVDFYNVKEGMTKLNRSVTYKYKSYYSVRTSDDETICRGTDINWDEINRTYYHQKYDCYKNETGDHLEEKFNWVVLNEKSRLPRGNVTIGIFTDVYPNENIEWIPTLFGVRINEWAQWTESLNDELFAYYNFTNELDEIGSYDLQHVVGNPRFTNNVSAFNVYSGFTGNNAKWEIIDNDRIDFTDNNYQFTINMWMRTNASDNEYFFNKQGIISSYFYNGLAIFSVAGATDLFSVEVPKNTWFMLTLIRNSTNFCVFINGSNLNCVARATPEATADNLFIGGNYDDASYNGYFDEMGFWSRSLSVPEVSDLYNNGAGVFHTTAASINENNNARLEWLYNCWYNGTCATLLAEINKTTTQEWQRIIGANTGVITSEQIINANLSSTTNISINYTIQMPYKSEVAINELLPIRMYFWFTDVARTTCYNQDKGTNTTNRAETPYCLPLIAEILGPNNGTISFRVNLKPKLSAGVYNITRSIEIDPLGGMD
jgi:hypothetical protein